jgi:hypothetical protein
MIVSSKAAISSSGLVPRPSANRSAYRFDWQRSCVPTKVLQDVDLERTMIHASSAGLGVALVPQAAKKTPPQKCRVSPSHAGRGDGGLCRMERRKSVCSLESLRGNRRARWAEHPLICGMAAPKLEVAISYGEFRKACDSKVCRIRP